MTTAQVSATVVRGYVDRFDDHLISTRYKDIWETITKRVIDKDMYLDAVRAGIITPEMHNRFHHEVPKKSYVLVTRIKRGGPSERPAPQGVRLRTQDRAVASISFQFYVNGKSGMGHEVSTRRIVHER